MLSHLMRIKQGLILVIISWVVIIIFWNVLPSHLRANESNDFQNFYKPVALRLLAGQGLTTPDGLPLLRYPPGYPVILATFLLVTQALHIPSSLVIPLFILVCVGLIVLLLYLLTSDVFGRKAGILASLIWIVYPGFLWLTKQPNSELPFLVLYLGGVLLFWKAFIIPTKNWFFWFLPGLLIGLSVLVRPAGLGVIGVLLLACLVSQRLNLQQKALACMALTISFSAVVLPWELWVYARTGQVIPVSTGAITGIWDGLTFGVAGEDEQFRYRLPIASRLFMEELQEQATLKGNTDDKQELWNIFIMQARLQPLAALQLIILKAARSWFATDSGRFEKLNLAIQVFFLAWIFLGAFSAWHMGSQQREFTKLILGISIYFWLITLSMLSILRYMIPAMAVLITLIPAGIFRFNSVSLVIDRFLSRILQT